GSIFEVYVPLDNKRKFCGYFNDIDAAIEEIARYDGTANVYVTLNPVRLSQKTQPTNKLVRCFQRTTDEDVDIDNWLFIDIDAKSSERTTNSKMSSTEAELNATSETGSAIQTYLHDEWGVPTQSMISAISGNGAYLLVNLPGYGIAEGWVTEKQKILSHLKARFSKKSQQPYGEVDISVHNPARLIGVIGTLKMKGHDTPERPHRRLRFVQAPLSLQQFDIRSRSLELDVLESKPKGWLDVERYGDTLQRLLEEYDYSEEKTTSGRFAHARCP